MDTHIFERTADLLVVGPAIRTSPASASVDIPRLWQGFLQAAPAAADVYAVYCDYESDHRGAYTMVLGVEWTAAAEPAAGSRRVTVPRGRYARLRASGHPAGIVWRTWSVVNGPDWPHRDERRYLADCERYATARLTPDRVEVEIEVGLR